VNWGGIVTNLETCVVARLAREERRQSAIFDSAEEGSWEHGKAADAMALCREAALHCPPPKSEEGWAFLAYIAVWDVHAPRQLSTILYQRHTDWPAAA
jgi:hypothetical protein